jgi:hypothetical protein
MLKRVLTGNSPGFRPKLPRPTYLRAHEHQAEVGVGAPLESSPRTVQPAKACNPDFNPPRVANPPSRLHRGTKPALPLVRSGAAASACKRHLRRSAMRRRSSRCSCGGLPATRTALPHSFRRSYPELGITQMLGIHLSGVDWGRGREFSGPHPSFSGPLMAKRALVPQRIAPVRPRPDVSPIGPANSGQMDSQDPDYPE